MSLNKNDRKIWAINGKEFPNSTNLASPDESFVNVIAGALHRGFGDTRSAVKTVVGLTGANERAVRNWFDAKNGPSGEHLIDLIRYSDDVLVAVLHSCGRDELILAHNLNETRRNLTKMISLLDELGVEN